MEKEFITERIPQVGNAIKDFGDINTMWAYVVELLKSHPEILKGITDTALYDVLSAMPDKYKSDMSKIVYYLNVIRTYDLSVRNYHGRHKSSFDVDIFHVEGNEPNLEYWKLFCGKGKINVNKLDGDHFSIFETNDIYNFSRKFSNLFREKELLLLGSGWTSERCGF